jgi:hypothetical protein
LNEFRRRQARYDAGVRLFGLKEANAFVPMLKETFTKVRELLDAGELEKAQAALDGITELGIEIKAADGLVDFRSVREGEIVYLCWKFPEDAILHWHRLDTGFAGRRPITAVDGFALSYVN